MKKLLLASVFGFASIVGSALAADMPAYKASPMAAPSYYNWSGYYIGFNIGGQWNEVERTFPLAGGFASQLAHTTKSTDGIFGFHAGLQYQWGYWVLGVEAALSAGFEEMRGVSGVLASPPFPVADTFSEHKVTNLFTLGPKLGYAFDRWMIYGTAGYATADLKGTYCSQTSGLCGGPNVTSGASRNAGWFAGGGLDYMIHKGQLVDVILGAEYQHWEVDAKRAWTNPDIANRSFDLAASGDIFRAKLTIKYNPFSYSPPVQARY